MKVGKKLLSVFLAIIMIMSSMSVCFGSITFASAADDTNAVKAFVAAMKCDAMKSFSTSYAETSKNSGANKEVTNTFTYTAPSYAYYEQVKNVVSKLDAAIKGLDEYKNGHNHNNGGNCQDGWGKGTATDKCTDLGWIERHLKIAIGDAELATLNGTYNFANLCNAIFNMDDCEWRNADNDLDGDDTTSTSNVEARVHNVLLVKVDSASSKLTSYNSISDIPDTLESAYQYKLSMCRQNYQTGGWWKTNHYHHALNTNNSDASNPAPAATGATISTNKAVLTNAKTALNSYSNYINAADVNAILAISNNSATLTTAYDAILAQKNNVINAHGTAVYNKFFSEVDPALKNISDAVNFLAFESLSNEIKALYSVDFSRMNESETLAHLTAFRAKWAEFTKLEQATQDLVASTYNIDVDAIEERIQEISDRYDSFRIRNLKATIDTHINMYEYLDIDDVDNAADPAAIKSTIFTAIATLYNDLNSLNSYDAALVAEVCGAGYKASVQARYNELSDLGDAADLNEDYIARYMAFVNDIQPATADGVDNATVRDTLKNYDAWTVELKNLIDSMKDTLGAEDAQKLYDEVDGVMKDYMAAAYVALNARVEAEIETAWGLYQGFKAHHKLTGIDFTNISAYNQLKTSIGLIDTDAYEFLKVSQNIRISQDAINKYNELVNFAVPGYQEFLDSFGFSEYQQSFIGDLVREESTDDIAREGTYTSTDAEIENVIKDLDALLGNPEITKLLGQLINKDKETGEWTGESFDLGSMLTDLIKDALFTDSMINTVVGMLYPLVVTEFIKVWANDLPAKNGDYDIKYIKDLYTIFKEAGFNAYPDLLASKLDSSKYASNIAILNAATANFKAANNNQYYTLKWSDADGKNIADKTPWDEAVLKRNVIDEETGEPVLNEDGTNVTEWALDWGVDAKREELEAGTITQAQFDDYFYQTFDDAVDGLKPLLLALLGNKAWSPSEVDHIADTKHKVIITLSVEVGLQLGATANRGYANLIIPVYEALGITGFKTASELEGMSGNENAAADILKGILDPIFNFADTTLKNAPLTTILNLLPNLAYALITDMVPELLDMLKTSITYKAIPYVIGGSINVSAFVDISGGADISVGSMLNLKDMGVDLSDGLNSLLPGFGLELPNIDQGTLATLGTLDQISTGRAESIYTAPAAGKAYHINANKADVLLFLLDYALGSGLLGNFIEIPAEGIIGELFAKLADADSREDILAAVVELLNAKKYNTLEEYEWYHGYVDNQQVGTLTGTPAYQIYMNPGNDWTKEKAEYLYNNIDALLGSILSMAGLDLDKTTEEVDGSLDKVISDAIGGLLSDKTLTGLAALLAKLDLNSLLAGDEEAEGDDANAPETVAEGEEEGEEAAAIEIDINALIKEFLGIDLASFATKYADIAAAVEADPEYVHDFGVDAGTTTFAAALAEMLAPLNSVVDFILKGENLVINISETQQVKLIGYDGYNNAIVPLLEALGCEVPASADVTNVLETVINALVARIDSITANGAIKGIIDILPGVLYFLAGNNLATVVRNLLQPVYVIIDTIRPIFDLDIAELIAGIEIGEEGNKKPLGLDLDVLNLNSILAIVEDLLLAEVDLGTLLTDVKQLIYDVCKVVGKEYTSVSTLQKTWKKGAYSADFDQADMLTVILSFVLEWATVEDNAEKLDELLNTNGIITALGDVFASVDISYGTPNWMYWFDSEEAFNEYLAGDANIPNTLASIDWENIEDNDWDKDTAQYFAENIDVLVDLIIAMINEGKVDAEGNALPTNLADLLGGLVNGLVNAETLNDLVGMITGLLGDIDENLINTAGYLLDVDLAGLKAYTCEAEIDSISDFINELANVLDTYASGLINWLFFGDDYRFAKKSDSTDTIVINGGLGYEKGLVMILEALGCELPAEVNTKSVLGALATRVEEILANPVDEVLELLPNLVYFLNANGAGVAVSNILAPVNALLDKLADLGLNVNLTELIGIDLAKLSLENIVAIVEGATDLPLDAAEDILVDFCTGKITKGEYIYRMDAAREDVITILLVVALELIYDDAFATKLNEMLDTDIVTGIKDIFNGSTITYVAPNWNYMDGIETEEGVIEYVNAITSYPNDWTEAKAEYLAENLPELVDMVIGMVEINGVKYDSLAALLQANVNIFTTETLNSLLDLIKNLLGNIDAELLEVGCIIDVDLAGLMAYTVPADIDTVDEFADQLAYILTTYAKGAVEWLLLGRDFKLLVKDADGTGDELVTDGSYITITGAQGYAEGLALLLEALGCEDLPAVYDVENLDTEATVKAVLASLAARIDEIFANPVEEVLDLLPNLIYFLDADGIDAVITNTTAALMALVDKLEVFGISLDINSLVNLPELMKIADKYEEGDDVIALDNLTLVALLKALSLMTGLDFAELESVLVPFALGEAVKYDSVSASDAYKMVYKTDLDKHDMISVIVTAALRMFVENEDNAKKLDEMIGTEIVSALKDVFAEVEISYVAPEWDYALTGDGEYMLTYSNNWNEATAEYVAAILPELGDLIAGLIDGNYDSLSALLNDKVNVFTSANLQSIVDLIADLLKDIDDGLLDAAGVLLGADVVGLKAYKAPEGITTVDAFAAELANVLNTYAKGVVEWLLLGKDYKFFVKEVKDGAPVDFITINGANGYSEGLALLLEALGCKDLPAADGKTEDIVTGVLASLAARIDEIFANPVEEVVELLPNLLYFLNTNGVAAVVNNTLAAVTALLTKLEAFGINVDIKELVNLKKLMKIEDTDAAISLDNLTVASLLEAVSYMVEDLDLTVVESALVGFDLGTIASYASLSKETGTPKKMTLATKDTVTILVNLVVLTLADEDNAEFVEGLVGEKAYAVIENLCVNGVVPAEIQEFDWKLTEKADTGEVFSALATSEMYKSGKYGPLYTEEMANYIADNFGDFVDNVIYLLGLEIIEGQTVDSLKDLINDLLGGSLYNSANVIAIRDALAGVLAGIKDLEVNGKNVGKYIAEVLKTAEIADINAVAKVEVPEFSEDRAMFVEYLCNVLEPLYPVLTWVLADDEIAFLANPDSTDAIKLEGGQGYQYGIIPLLEVLECKDILAPADYYAAVEANGDVVITSILDPLLNRVDEIINNDPAQQILDMLPNLIYFINSNGVDTVVKNTLHAVYGLLSAIAPIAEIDLYELIGIDLAEIDFDWLFNKLLEIIKDATGYEFSTLDANALAELTVGKLESYGSLSGKTAYKMVYAEGESGNKAEMVTVVMRLIVTFIMHENNREMLLGLLRDNLGMSADAEKYVRGILDTIATVAVDTYLGMDQALATLYYLFYGADIGVDGAAGGLKDLNKEWQNILKELGMSDDPNELTIGNLLAKFLGDYFEDVLTPEGVAPNGFIAFFQRIIEWFNKIIEWFKNLFN